MKIRKAIGASGAVLALLGATAPLANAATQTTWYAAAVNGGAILNSPSVYQNMNRSIAQAPSGHLIGVAAHTSNGAIYGSWVYADGYICHNYAQNSLGGNIYNGTPNAFKIYGIVIQAATETC